jgi:hypothetical protein
MNQSITGVNRRDFLHTAAAIAGGAVVGTLAPSAQGAEDTANKVVATLYESLTEAQRKAMCFEWDKKGYGGLPLRLHVTNNWAVSPVKIGDLTADQQALVGEVLNSVLAEGWAEKLAKQAKDDTAKAWTEDRKIAIFGTPMSGKCQCVISGFHLTFRAGREKDSPAAFGGAICHGHQPSGFNEKPGHPGNIFWYQALAAHKVYQLLDGKQQKLAVLEKGMPYYEFDGKIDRTPILPDSKFDRSFEPDVRFKGIKAADLPGLPIAEMSRDQKDAMRKVLGAMLEPYRETYRKRVEGCLLKQGGFEKCRLMFYKEHTLGKDGEWDNWRVEGPSFVWYFRGFPHVHIADTPDSPVTSHFG